MTGWSTVDLPPSRSGPRAGIELEVTFDPNPLGTNEDSWLVTYTYACGCRLAHYEYLCSGLGGTGRWDGPILPCAAHDEGAP